MKETTLKKNKVVLIMKITIRADPHMIVTRKTIRMTKVDLRKNDFFYEKTTNNKLALSEVKNKILESRGKKIIENITSHAQNITDNVAVDKISRLIKSSMLS